MAYRVTCFGLLLASLLTAGCGTVANLARPRPEEGGRIPFGGVRHDVSCITRAANGELGPSPQPKSGSGQDPQLALVMLCAIDLPLSLIGDVVTWPYTAAYSFINQPVPTPRVVQAPVGVEVLGTHRPETVPDALPVAGMSGGADGRKRAGVGEAN